MPTLREFFLKIRDRSKSLIKNQSKNLYSQSKSTYNKVLDTEVGDIKKGAVGAADLTVKASKSLLIYIYMAGLIMIAIPSGIFLLYLLNEYTSGEVYESALLPSSIAAVLLTFLLPQKRKATVIIFVFLIAFINWQILRYFGDIILSFFSLIVTLGVGTLIVIFSNLLKNKDASNKGFITYMVCFIIFISSYSLNSSLQDAYQNNIKPLHQNYSLANNYYDMKIRPNFFGSYNFYEPKQKKILMTHKNKEISSDIMNFIHYNHTGENISNYDFKTNDSRLNNIYSECIDINRYDIECIISKEDPLFIDDKCLWTFLGYNTVAINKNYYLINMKERMCGSGTLKGNSYYLFNYDGKTIEIMDSIAPGDKTIWTQREIKYFMFVDYGYEFVTSACYEGSDSCKGQRATRSGLRIK